MFHFHFDVCTFWLSLKRRASPIAAAAVESVKELHVCTRALYKRMIQTHVTRHAKLVPPVKVVVAVGPAAATTTTTTTACPDQEADHGSHPTTQRAAAATGAATAARFGGQLLSHSYSQQQQQQHDLSAGGAKEGKNASIARHQGPVARRFHE